ncbi:MAG: hypothetical protein JWL66_1949, partial [Sphingomonadales bacterium]|nr:hypothetical protein [Sphingomonadales bacterium]
MNTQSQSAIVNEPGVPVIRNINLVGLKT